MTLNVALHGVTDVSVNRFTHEGERCASITFTSDEGGRILLFVPPVVADAMAEAFKESMARHEAGRVAAYVARQRIAELPDDQREVMQLKGMI